MKQNLPNLANGTYEPYLTRAMWTKGALAAHEGPNFKLRDANPKRLMKPWQPTRPINRELHAKPLRRRFSSQYTKL